MTKELVDPRAERIDHLTRTIGNAAMELARLASPPRKGAHPSLSADWIILKACAKELYTERRLRQQYFDTSLFSEPAWDMLLDLYIAELANERRTTMALCVGCEIASTTGLRWLSILEARGLIRRKSHATDRRCQNIELSDAGRETMSRYLAGVLGRRTGRRSADAA
jgi:DNA-binding MarR family transcriptional regulator